jgi:hypothetical protein
MTVTTLRCTRGLRLGLAVGVAAFSLAATALAVVPKKGAELYGGTSLPGTDDYIFMKVAPSGTVLSMSLPAVQNIAPPRLTKIRISGTGHFSVTRSVTGSSSEHGASADWTIKVTGRFTAPTKATGTFSAKGIVHRAGDTRISSGVQTFKLKFYK